MNFIKSIEQLQMEYLKIMDSQCFIESDLDYSVAERLIPYFQKIDELSNTAFLIFDLYKHEHIFVSNNISQVFKLEQSKTIGDSEYMNQRVHPDDLYGLYEAGAYFLHYGMQLSPEFRKEGKLVNEYRILNEKDKYIRVIEQQMCLELDKNGNVWLALGVMDLSPEQNLEAAFCSRLIDFRTENIYLFPPPNKENFLTSREQEILNLISKGLISKEIADKLFISVKTVNTHRQKILEKFNVNNSIEAINYAQKLGII